LAFIPAYVSISQLISMKNLSLFMIKYHSFEIILSIYMNANNTKQKEIEKNKNNRRIAFKQLVFSLE